MPQTTLYERIGGSQVISDLVNTYLRILQENPQYSQLRGHYARGFEHYKTRMTEYLSGFLGGPSLYQDLHGLPLLRENHQRLEITPQMRDLWYGCMEQAISEVIQDESLQRELSSVFWMLADSLCNA